jgi:thiol-disulfide isomerase/thioredoxin
MKRVSFFLFLTLVLTACSAALTVPASKAPDMKTSTQKPTLPDLGLAPELTNTVWLNVAAPLRLANLRGKVVLLDMWTFGCINCQHVLPALKDWHSQYADQGLVIIGNHYPEFSHEADLNNLKAAVAKNEILYPVSQDNDGATWNAYKTQYWPTMYLIDKNGHLRYMQIGEGAYDQTETAIKALLAEPASTN